MDGDYELYVLVLREFLNSQRADGASLQALHAAQDWVAAERLAHSAKATSQSLGFLDLAQVSREQEVLFKKRSPSPHLEGLVEAFVQLQGALVVAIEDALRAVDAGKSETAS
jgi:HPt (histidine-containing phosphotransfer) domain-containing protein